MTAYKQTELGLIPSDWEVVALGDICSIKTGGTPSTNEISFWNGDINWCTPTDITSLNNKYLSRTNKKISELGLQNSAAELLPIGTILMTSRATIGECAITSELMTTNQGFKNFICGTKINNEFLYYLLISKKSNFISLCSGSTFLEISTTQIRKFEVFIPPKPEQTAIATALSDTDALLAELEKLLAKKQAIKTATMQQLLTGKTRLPEFAHRADGTPKGSLKTEWGDIPEDWEVVALGDVGYFQAGVGFPLTIQGKKSGKYPFFKVSDLNNIGNETYLQASNNYINEQDKELISAKTIPINSIVFAKIGAAVFLERKRINNQESLIDNNMMAYIPNHKFLYKFAYYCFLRMKLSLLVEVTALPSLSSTELGKTKIFIPKSITEQTAIAQILGDMDSEITALQARIEKLREIKQGMMQNLLTGKIRLLF